MPKATLDRSTSIHDDVAGYDDAMARATTKAESSSFSASLFAPLWSALYSCSDLLCLSGEDTTTTMTTSTTTTHHRVQNASLMEFMGNGMGGILHKDSMSTVGEDYAIDLRPDAIYGKTTTTFNLDQAMQDFGSEEEAEQPNAPQQQQQQTQEHRTPSLQSLSSSSSSSSSLLSHEAEVAVRRQTSLEDQVVEEGAKTHIAGVPIIPPLPLEMIIPTVSTMPRPMTPVL